MIVWIIILILIAALCDGFIELIKHHYNKVSFKNEQYWNPSISWKNKWKSDLKTEKFFLSSTALCWLTDAYHLFRMIERQTIILAICLLLPYNILISMIVLNIIYTVGFYITYK